MECIYFKKMRDGKIYFKELNENTPYLIDDELPGYCESSGFVFNNFRPLMDAKVEYENGELAVKQSNGKEDFIPLSDITKCTIEPFFLSKKKN
jgi:hypothetical protein